MSFEDSNITGYLGSPNERNNQENSSWKKFLLWAVPWLKKKALIADQALEAELVLKIALAEKTKAEVEKTRAETEKTKAETEKTRTEAVQIQFQIAKQALELEEKKIDLIKKEMGIDKDDDLNLNLEQIQILKSSIEEKLSTLSVMHGTKLVNVKKVEPEKEKQEKKPKK